MYAERSRLGRGQLNTQKSWFTLVLLCLLQIVVSVAVNPQVYKPWLDKHPAKVLSLSCGAPGDTSQWSMFRQLALYYRPFEDDGRPEKAQQLTVMTQAVKSPIRRSDLLNISRVNFTGNWNEMSTACLFVVMPFQSGTYNCTALYTDKITKKDKTYWKSIQVKEFSTEPIEEDKFKVAITVAHKVSVTWKSPVIELVFREARVWLTPLDSNENDRSAPLTVFMALAGKVKFPTYIDGVLLHMFESPAGIKENGNYSILLYVDIELCKPKCRYSCFVPYQSCVGSDASLCDCNHVSPERPSSEPSYKIAFIVSISIAVIISAGLIIFVCLRMKNKFSSLCVGKTKRQGVQKQNGDDTGAGEHLMRNDQQTKQTGAGDRRPQDQPATDDNDQNVRSHLQTPVEQSDSEAHHVEPQPPEAQSGSDARPVDPQPPEAQSGSDAHPVDRQPLEAQSGNDAHPVDPQPPEAQSGSNTRHADPQPPAGKSGANNLTNNEHADIMDGVNCRKTTPKHRTTCPLPQT